METAALGFQQFQHGEDGTVVGGDGFWEDLDFSGLPLLGWAREDEVDLLFRGRDRDSREAFAVCGFPLGSEYVEHFIVERCIEIPCEDRGYIRMLLEHSVDGHCRSQAFAVAFAMVEVGAEEKDRGGEGLGLEFTYKDTPLLAILVVGQVVVPMAFNGNFREDCIPISPTLEFNVLTESEVHSGESGEFSSLVDFHGATGTLVNFLQGDDIGGNRLDDFGNPGQVEFSVDTFTMMDVVAEYADSEWLRAC